MINSLNNSNDEISIKEIFQKLGRIISYLKKNLWKISLIGVLFGALGFVYAKYQPINYTAKLTFVLEDSKASGGGLGNLASLAGQFGVDVGSGGGVGGVLSGDNILLYFKSESLAKEVLLTKYDVVNGNEVKTLADLYAEIYGLKSKWAENKNIGNVKFQPNQKVESGYTRLQDSLIQVMVRSILKSQFSVSKIDKKAGFIEVATTMKDEFFAKLYCESIVKIAVEKYINLKTQQQRISVDKLQTRVDSISYLLSKKTITGATLQTSTSTMDINPIYKTGTAVAVETLTRDKTMLASIFAAAVQNLELAKFTLNQETPVIQIIDKPSFPLEKKKTSKLIFLVTGSLVGVILSTLYLLLKNWYNNLN